MDDSTTTRTRGTLAPGARTWLTVPELAEFLRPLVAADDEDALRFMLDGLNKVDDVLSHDALDDFAAEPPSLGDVRWDTLLACSTAYVLRKRGITPPSWTTKPSLSQWWWPAGERRRRALTMQRTPIDFRRVGIWFSERNFLTA